MDFSSLIGQEETKVRQFLEKNGYNNIETIINAKHNDLCDTLIVCKIKNENTKITLICGEFCKFVKE